MGESSATWFTELGIDCYNMINDCEMNSFDALDEEVNNGNQSGQGKQQQQSLSSDSYSSASSTATLSFQKPAKSANSRASTTSSPNPHYFLSFANPNTSSPAPYPVVLKPKEEPALSPIPPSDDQFKARKRSGTMERSPVLAQDHIIAERKRREKLSLRFIALSALVPGLKKMDKASVLGDAIKYLKQLQEQVKSLEDQVKKRDFDSVVLVKKSRISVLDDDASSILEESDRDTDQMLPEIEARVSEKSVLIRIHCEKRMGLLTGIWSEIEKLGLNVINSSTLKFGNYDLVITIVAQMEEELSITAEELVKKLRFLF